MSLFIGGRGYRIVGDHIATLHPGDLVLVGANLPHLWHHDDWRQGASPDIHFITINFREDFLGEPFLGLPEFKLVAGLFHRAKQGLRVSGATRDRVEAGMRAIAAGQGLRRVIDLLEILDILSRSTELESIATAGFMPEINLVDEQRLSRVSGHIIEHLHEEIHRAELARLVSLTPVSFSRYFKSRTGKTLPDFINELRIGRVCRMLAEGEQSVTDIALACGFPNLAHFHRQFRRRVGTSPRDYRALVNRRE